MKKAVALVLSIVLVLVSLSSYGLLSHFVNEVATEGGLTNALCQQSAGE